MGHGACGGIAAALRGVGDESERSFIHRWMSIIDECRDEVAAGDAPDKQRAAWEFVKWWISPEQAAFWSQNTGYFPVRNSSIDLLTQQGYYRERPQFKTTIDQLQYAREAPLTPHWPAIAKEITKGMEAILVSNQPALEALTRAQERAQAIVEG